MQSYPWRFGFIAAAAMAAFSLLPNWGHAEVFLHENPPLRTDSVTQPELSTMVLQQRPQRARAAVEPVQINLGPWTYQNPQSSDISGPVQVGAPRVIAATASTQDFQRQAHWTATASGGWLTAVSIQSPEAYALRLGVEVRSLPVDATLRVYSPNHADDAYETSGQQILELIQANHQAAEDASAANTWWTPEVEGEAITLEIELPVGTTPEDVHIALPQLVHIYANIFSPEEMENFGFYPMQAASSCNIDSSCHEEYGTQRNSVARMSYVKDGKGYLCSGTLINDTASSRTPHFLTANHCINSQAAASSLQTWWFYRSNSCNQQNTSSSQKILRNGAVLLHASANGDFSLLRLNDAPPAGAIFSGWDSGSVAIGQSLVGIHHPAGDLQKISFGTLHSYANCDPIQGSDPFSCRLTYDPKSTTAYYYLKWQNGTTEGGSSGSGLFKDGRLIGVLSGGSGACTLSERTSVYGKFSSILPSLRKWLAAEASTPIQDIPRQAVYRFFNTATGAHFYTNSTPERDSIISNLPNYRYEGISFYAATQQAQGLGAVSRFFNNDSNSHFYTISANESESIKANLPQFRYEGLAWYASPVEVQGMQPIYRFYNEQTGAHFYTATESERDTVLSNLPRFRYEGTAYYIWSKP